jgi:hypothetical protein
MTYFTLYTWDHFYFIFVTPSQYRAFRYQGWTSNYCFSDIWIFSRNTALARPCYLLFVDHYIPLWPELTNMLLVQFSVLLLFLYLLSLTVLFFCLLSQTGTENSNKEHLLYWVKNLWTRTVPYFTLTVSTLLPQLEKLVQYIQHLIIVVTGLQNPTLRQK